MGFVLYALIPVILGFLAPLWFGKMIPSVRTLRNAAKWIDALPATTPSAPATVKTLRDHEKCGDKIVVAHHLGKWTRDLEGKILHAFCFNGAATLVLVIIVAVKNSATLQAPNASFRDLLDAIVANWPLSIGLAVSLLEILFVVKLVSELAAKYSDVIEAARPVQKGFWARAFGK